MHKNSHGHEYLWDKRSKYFYKTVSIESQLWTKHDLIMNHQRKQQPTASFNLGTIAKLANPRNNISNNDTGNG